MFNLIGLNNECQAYFQGAPAYNSNYRPVYAHMGVESYVDLSTIKVTQDTDTWLVFNVLTVTATEDSDSTKTGKEPSRFGINKKTREAWMVVDSKWKRLELNRVPFGYEVSSFNTVNMCYLHLYGEFLNDSSGGAEASGSNYKGK